MTDPDIHRSIFLSLFAVWRWPRDNWWMTITASIVIYWLTACYLVYSGIRKSLPGWSDSVISIWLTPFDIALMIINEIGERLA